jgi:autotransporter-associated beta strand protein
LGLCAAAAAAAAVLQTQQPARAITINPTYTASVTSHPNSAAIQNAFNYVCLQFKNMYSDPINVNITVVAGTTGLGGSSTGILGTNTYTQMRTALINDATSAEDTAANASLPALSPLPVGALAVYSRAEAKALNIFPDDLANDGTFTFNGNLSYSFDPANREPPLGGFDFIAVAEHEASEIMGRIPSLGTNFFGQQDYLPYDMFRWTGAGARNLSDAAGVYFSLDSGATNLKNFNFANGNGSDPQDWASGTNDAYNAFSSSDVVNLLPPVDFTTCDVMGYNRANLLWSGATDHVSWNIFNTSNWTNSSGNTKYTDAAQVVFDDSAGAANLAVTLNQTVRPNSVTFNNAAFNYTLSGTGAITGQGSLSKSGAGTTTISCNLTYTGTTTVSAGKLSLSTNLTSSPSVTVSGGTLELTPLKTRVLRSPVISVTGSGKIDLQDNKLITASAVGTLSGVNYTGITGLIQSGFNPATPARWDGATGILTSQTTATTSNLTSIGIATAQQAKGLGSPGLTAVWAGQTVTGTDTLVMYTYGGDANLDGKVNIDDYGKIDGGIGAGLKGWFNGDFNYDGKVNVDDYGIIDANIGIATPPFPTAWADGQTVGGQGGGAGPGMALTSDLVAAGGLAGAAGPTAAVPDPATGAVLLAALLTLRCRRRNA